MDAQLVSDVARLEVKVGVTARRAEIRQIARQDKGNVASLSDCLHYCMATKPASCPVAPSLVASDAHVHPEETASLCGLADTAGATDEKPFMPDPEDQSPPQAKGSSPLFFALPLPGAMQ
jgi:hypothetical protein